MKKRIGYLAIIGLALCLVLGQGGPARATQVNDTSLSISFTPGTGNSNQHFAVDSNAVVEVGLKAKLRYLGDVIPVGNLYTVPAGYHQADKPGYADWNFDFSVLLPKSKTFADYNVSFDLDKDPSPGTDYVRWVDLNWSVWLAQDSWNYGMPFLNIAGFNANTNGLYDIVLSVYENTGTVPIVSSHIQVQAVSEPGILLLLGTGMLGLALVGRKTRRQRA